MCEPSARSCRASARSRRPSRAGLDESRRHSKLDAGLIEEKPKTGLGLEVAPRARSRSGCPGRSYRPYSSPTRRSGSVSCPGRSSSAGRGIGGSGSCRRSDRPEEPTGLKPLQLPSGVGVLPVRTLSATPVPAGVSAVHERASQLTDWPASRTRESKCPRPGRGSSASSRRRARAPGVEVAGGRAHRGREGGGLGGHQAAVDVVADLVRRPLDPVAVLGTDQRAGAGDRRRPGSSRC